MERVTFLSSFFFFSCQQKQLEKSRKERRKARNAAKAAGEFDDLVSALRSGDLYGDSLKPRRGTTHNAQPGRKPHHSLPQDGGRERRKFTELDTSMITDL